MAKIRILFVDHTPFPGGAQLCLARDIQYLDRSIFEPFLLIDKDSKYTKLYSHSNAAIYKIPFGRLKSLQIQVIPTFYRSVTGFNKVVREIKPDIVLANTSRAFLLSALSEKRFTSIVYIRDYDYPKWVLPILSGRIDKFLFVSDSVAKYYNLTKAKSETIYLGSQATGSNFFKDSLKGKYGFKKSDFVIGFVGRLVDWKGPLYLLNAFSQIADTGIKLVYFGTGEGQKGSVESQLRLAIKRLKLTERVQVVGFERDINRIYSAIDCFVLSSIRPEPFATSVIEAALARVPIIATDIGGTAEFIHHNENGLLVDPGNTAQLAQALLNLSSNKKLRENLAAQAYKDVQNFNEGIFIKKLSSILLKVYESRTRT